jgi:hypothetical protein
MMAETKRRGAPAREEAVISDLDASISAMETELANGHG